MLGPVLVQRPGPAAGKRARALLSVLALTAGERFAEDELARRVWPTPPPDAAAALDVLRTQLDGVDLDGLSTDADRFAVLTRRAEGEGADGDLAAAEATLVEALALWRGAALEDVRDTPYLAAEALRLEEARLTAVEDRLDLATRQGRHGEILDEVRALADTYPTRERLWGLLMTALYRSGRRDEAITVYAEARDTLADELGIEPGEALQQLEAGMLRNDPALGDGPGEAGSPQPRRRARIPVLASSTFGRDDLCAEVAELVVRDDVRLVTLTGIGGSGQVARRDVGGRRRAGPVLRRRVPPGDRGDRWRPAAGRAGAGARLPGDERCGRVAVQARREPCARSSSSTTSRPSRAAPTWYAGCSTPPRR